MSPRRLPLTDPLAQVMGARNALTFDLDLLGPVTIEGAGAGRVETGARRPPGRACHPPGFEID